MIPGSSEHSFGIHVAKMAGMPKDVLKIANNMLRYLEQTRSKKEIDSEEISQQLNFFESNDPTLDELKIEIEKLNLDELTPIQALLKLNELKRRLNN